MLGKTTRVHCKRAPYDIYIGRPSIFGNPYTHHKDKDTKAEFIVETREEAVAKYREYITEGSGKHLLEQLHTLEGKVLGCWCMPDKACHGDILIELIEEKKQEQYELNFCPNCFQMKNHYLGVCQRCNKPNPNIEV